MPAALRTAGDHDVDAGVGGAQRASAAIDLGGGGDAGGVRATQPKSVPKLTDSRLGRAANAASNNAGSPAMTQSTRPMPNGPVTSPSSASSVRSADVVAALPMPIMPRPPAAVTAAASRPPATPPIGALTIGSRRPMPADQCVVSVIRALLGMFGAQCDGEQHRGVLHCLQGVPFHRDRDPVAGLALPGVVGQD